jgi:DNA-binding transcriptional MerR regulator
MKKVKNIFREKMEENYETLADFLRRSRVPVSWETARRIIYNREQSNTASFLMVAKYLGFTNEEIREFLQSPELYFSSDPKESRFAKDFIEMMGYGLCLDITDEQRRILAELEKIKEEDAALFNYIIASIGIICKALRISCDNIELLQIPRGGGD